MNWNWGVCAKQRSWHALLHKKQWALRTNTHNYVSWADYQTPKSPATLSEDQLESFAKTRERREELLLRKLVRLRVEIPAISGLNWPRRRELFNVTTLNLQYSVSHAPGYELMSWCCTLTHGSPCMAEELQPAANEHACMFTRCANPTVTRIHALLRCMKYWRQTDFSMSWERSNKRGCRNLSGVFCRLCSPRRFHTLLMN